MKPLLVGEANPYSQDPEDALFPWPPGSAGGRLCRLLGWGQGHYLRAFDRVNLYTIPPRTWSAPAARQVAGWILAEREGDVVLLGARVVRAFLPDPIPLWTRCERFVALPHPSGRSREWHHREAVERLRALLDPYFPAGERETAAEARSREAWQRGR